MRLSILLLGAALVLSPMVSVQDDSGMLEALREAAHPVESPGDLGPLYDRIGNVRYVLLGESTHGTSEFYTWRAAISRKLIEDYGFSFIIVEGDWDLCYRVNRYVKALPGAGASAREVLLSFDRWPRWMWANEETAELIEWLREFNKGREARDKVGFYGMDVQNPEGSLRELKAYLDATDAEITDDVAALISGFEPYAGSARRYTQALSMGIGALDAQLERAVSMLREEAETLSAEDPNAFFNAKQNAVVLKRAERYYRAMLSQGGESWNARVDHFHATVERVTDFYGPEARAIAWAHNTHIGDARATAMGAWGRRNIGQLLREKHGEDAVVLAGFGTYRGRVLAGESWESAMRQMTIPEGAPGTYEDLLNRLGFPAVLLLFTPEHRNGPLAEERGHRAIGVVYNPAQEFPGNYVPTVLPRRYDAFIFIAETGALNPLRH